MELKDSLPCSQKPTTRLCLKVGESNPNHNSLFLMYVLMLPLCLRLLLPSGSSLLQAFRLKYIISDPPTSTCAHVICVGIGLITKSSVFFSFLIWSSCAWPFTAIRNFIPTDCILPSASWPSIQHFLPYNGEGIICNQYSGNFTMHC